MHPRIAARLQDNLNQKLVQLDRARTEAVTTLRQLRAELELPDEAELELLDAEINRIVKLLDAIDLDQPQDLVQEVELVDCLETFATSLKELADRPSYA